VSDFRHFVDLASQRLGGRVLEANDEFFAPKENLLKPSKPIFIEGKYTDRGKWMDGWETLKLLRLDAATRDIPVAMFTILFDLREKVRALKYGAQEYVTKPFEMDDFLRRVRRVLEGPARSGAVSA